MASVLNFRIWTFNVLFWNACESTTGQALPEMRTESAIANSRRDGHAESVYKLHSSEFSETNPSVDRSDRL